MNYYDEIKEKLLKSEIYDRIKEYCKDRNKVKVYFEIGKLLSRAGKEYGKSIIKKYSEKLMIEVGKKYNERTLRRIRQFYETFSNEKWSTLWTKLSWSHFRKILTLKDYNEICYYLNTAENNNLTIRQLQLIIKNHEYNRLSVETKKKLLKSQQLKVDDLIPNPKHRNYDNYMANRKTFDKVKDNVYNLVKGAKTNDEIGEKNLPSNKKKNNSMVDGRGLLDSSSFSMQDNKWQEYLEKKLQIEVRKNIMQEQ